MNENKNESEQYDEYDEYDDDEQYDEHDESLSFSLISPLGPCIWVNAVQHANHVFVIDPAMFDGVLEGLHMSRSTFAAVCLALIQDFSHVAVSIDENTSEQQSHEQQQNAEDSLSSEQMRQIATNLSFPVEHMTVAFVRRIILIRRTLTNILSFLWTAPPGTKCTECRDVPTQARNRWLQDAHGVCRAVCAECIENRFGDAPLEYCASCAASFHSNVAPMHFSTPSVDGLHDRSVYPLCVHCGYHAAMHGVPENVIDAHMYILSSLLDLCWRIINSECFINHQEGMEVTAILRYIYLVLGAQDSFYSSASGNMAAPCEVVRTAPCPTLDEYRNLQVEAAARRQRCLVTWGVASIDINTN